MPKTLLIIEDEEPLRLLLTELLRGAGYRVLTAPGGQQGLRLARAHRPDLVLSDIRMPGMDGHAVLAELRKIPGFDSVPVIIMTAHAALPDMRRSMTAGADDYVAKPFENAELLRTVERHLARVEQRRRQSEQALDTLRRGLSERLPQQFVTPLHDIIGCASVLAVDAGVMPPAEVREFAQNIQEAGERLHRQIENLLLYTHLEAGHLQLNASTPVPVDQIVQTVAEQVARRHRRFEMLQLRLQPVEAPLPREHLAKIISELVDNACRHTPAGSTVRVDLRVEAESFTIEIADEGGGLPAATLQAIEQGASDGAGAGLTLGGGLGLFLARRLTHAIGGGWEVSGDQRGLRLVLTFPRAGAAA